MIQITGMPIDSALRVRVEHEMQTAVARIRATPVSAQATFVDENGPKAGRVIRCALTVRLPRHPAIHVEHAAENARLAFDVAFEALDRQLHELFDRARELRRRPKKYFAAKRLLGSGEEVTDAGSS
jgi:ribosome-associated translation inhibitor RaiA